MAMRLEKNVDLVDVFRNGRKDDEGNWVQYHCFGKWTPRHIDESLRKMMVRYEATWFAMDNCEPPWIDAEPSKLDEMKEGRCFAVDAKTEFESADFWTIANYRSHIGYFTVPELASRTGLAADKIESELAFLREQEVVMLTGTARGLPEYRFIAEYEASGSESEYFVVNGLPLCRKCRDGVHGHHLDHGCKVTFHKDSRNLGQCNCWISDRKETAFRKRWQQVSEQRSKASTSV